MKKNTIPPSRFPDAARPLFRGQAWMFLPARVRDFALERCLILTIGGANAAACWPASVVDKRKKRWIILVDEGMNYDIESTIAHEIAHAWLGHLASGSADHPHSNDFAADAQSREWGFSPSYPPDHSHHP